MEYAAGNMIEDELNLPGAKLTFIQYFCLDIFIPLIIGVFIIVWVVYRVLSTFIEFVYLKFVKIKVE